MKKVSLKEKEFIFLKKKGNKFQGRFYIILFSDNKEQTKWAVIASKRLGNAVKRNYQKRCVREIIYKEKLLEKIPYKTVSVICLARKSSFMQKKEDLTHLFKKMSSFKMGYISPLIV